MVEDEGIKVEVTKGGAGGAICADVVMGGSDLDGDSWEIVVTAVGVTTDPGVVLLIGRTTFRMIKNWVSTSLLLTSLPPMLYCVVTVIVTGPAG